MEDFAPALRNLLGELKDDKKLILLVLDDINGLASSVIFANWLKSLVDEIATSAQPLVLCVLFVGLEERRQALIEGQPSLSRVFELVELRAWSKEETKQFFRQTFAKVGMEIEESALELLYAFVGGLPVLAHELGDAVFKADEDRRIDEQDALKGIVAAADIVGRKYLEPQVFRAIRSPRYRAILRKLATPQGAIYQMAFNRKDLLMYANVEEKKVLDNFLQRMKKLGVIRSEPDGGPGSYVFGNLLHYVYFGIEARRAAREPANLA